MLHTLPQPDLPQSAPRKAPVLPLEIWGATDRGRQREGNEDSIYPHSVAESTSFRPNAEHLAHKGQLLLVADGVGGAKAGAEASQWAVRVAVDRYYDLPGPDPSADLQAAIEVANVSLYQYLQSTATQEAGCTMAAAVIHRNLLYVANVGDSRVYVIRNGQIAQQTRDHTLTQQKVDHQIITAEDAKVDPDQHVLTRSLGADDAVRVDVFSPLQLFEGDVVLICSDGLTDMLEDTEIVRVLGSSSMKRGAQRLIEAANKRGGVDNISVVLARAGRKPPGGGGLLEWGRNLVDSVRRMALWQKLSLLAGGAFIVVAFCVMVALGWWMYEQGREKSMPTPTPRATEEVTTAPTETVAPTDTPSPIPTKKETIPTSTPAPTLTPVPTLIPPTNTPVPPTDTPIPPTATPDQGGGGGGGEPEETPGGKPKPTANPGS